MTEMSPWRSVARMADAAVCAALADLAERVGATLAARAARQLGQGIAEQPADVETAIDRVARERNVDPARLRAVVEQTRRPVSRARVGTEVINLVPGWLRRVLDEMEPESWARRTGLSAAANEVVAMMNRDVTLSLDDCVVTVLGKAKYGGLAPYEVSRIVTQAAS
jgi:hypothetical protein